MSKTKKYKNCPLIETVCEFQFINKEQWDATIPGVLYDRIKNEFPLKKQAKNYYQLVGIQPDNELSNLTLLTQFYSQNEQRLIQVGKNTFTANCLKPYPHWEEYKPMILKNYKVYNEISSPLSIRQVALRYINKINIPLTEGKNLSLKEYFNYYPHKPESIKGVMGSIDTIIQMPYESKRDILMLRLATLIPESEKEIPFLLQIDYLMAKPEQLPISEIEDWLEKAHLAINTTFELSITDKCKDLFN